MRRIISKISGDFRKIYTILKGEYGVFLACPRRLIYLTNQDIPIIHAGKRHEALAFVWAMLCFDGLRRLALGFATRFN